MTAPLRKSPATPATYDEIEALPANVVGEIIYGALHAHPRPSPRHAVAASALGAEISTSFQVGRAGPGGWIFMVEPELHLNAHVLVPDIAGWRTARMPSVPDTAFIDLPPDWVCEILSPSTARIDRTDKLTIYGEQGVTHCWYVDPIGKTLEVFALEGGRYFIAATFKAGDTITAPPFEAHTFPLNVLWPLDSEGAEISE